MAGISIDPREICDLERAAALPPLPPHIFSGALVVARGARWRVEACVDRDGCRELHLDAVTGAGRRVLLWPFDRPEPVHWTAGPRVLSLARWTTRAARCLARETDPLTPRAAFAGTVLPYQLAAAMAMAAG